MHACDMGSRAHAEIGPIKSNNYDAIVISQWKAAART
jgi:hypothetical protein